MIEGRKRAPNSKGFGKPQERTITFNKRNEKLYRLRQLYEKQEYSTLIKRARPLLEIGIAEAYILTLNSCKKLKNVKLAEKIVNFALKQKFIHKELLFDLLANVYLEVNEVEKYIRLKQLINKMNKEKEDKLSRISA